MAKKKKITRTDYVAPTRTSDGTKIGDPGMEAMSKVLTERNKNLNFVERAKNPQLYPSVQTNTLRGYEGADKRDRSTHLMTSEFFDNTFNAFPTLEYTDGKLESLPNDRYPKETISTKGAQLARYYDEVGMKRSTGLAQGTPVRQQQSLTETPINAVSKKKSIVQLRKGLRYY